MSPEPLEIEPLDLGSDLPLRFYRVTPWAISHWHPYIVATENTALLRLGGFTTAEIPKLAELMQVDAASEQALWTAAMILATAADPNGSHDLRIPRLARQLDMAAVATWKARQEVAWPRDSIAWLPGGRVRVVLTVLSREERVPMRPWCPIAYAFEFDEDGNLLAWASRYGTPWIDPEGEDPSE